MKQSLSKLLVRPIVKDEETEEVKEAQVDEEYEEIFKTMETVSDTPIVKKRKQSDTLNDETKKRKRKKKIVTQK